MSEATFTFRVDESLKNELPPPHGRAAPTRLHA